ncbi:exported hypothetical protein [Methylocella tundrae]|uniref:Uncharacterized protein n=1 Tax=Methylocella tundrae TaxID=227605 RepID=A0A8B6M2Y5_METTU|nr:hypothetical protein [Methylocella tundrae]VTZ28484.1 exported hypothetical protein [Methylocella tundrae]VTZ49387.1 exported hypothetical protein [Methylocella tundrae]
MKELGKVVVGAAVACAFSSGAIAQVRTFGPAAPYLVTGRSVSVPPYEHHAEKPYEQAGAQGRLDSGSGAGQTETPSGETPSR